MTQQAYSEEFPFHSTLMDAYQGWKTVREVFGYAPSIFYLILSASSF
jgi:hypothetical protein